MANRPFKKVLIVGAGPSGLLLALLLSKHGIPVTVVEMSDQLDQNPRAAHYGPPAIPDLQRAGILDDLRTKGLSLSTMCWRRSEDHSYIAGFDMQVLSDVDGNDWRTVSYPLQDLDQLMLDHFVDKYNGDIRWLHKVLDVGQDAEKAWVDVETPEGKERIEADYIVGCDGANSAVRRSLFGSEFPGFTWDAQIIATNTYYDFEGKFGFHDANFIIHPEHFFMAAKMTADGLYRVTYGETPGLFRVGRVLLAADAAHLCNPWGGLGITGGLVDCGGLYDCLAGIWDGKADESILDVYSEKRIEKWKTIIDPISQENFRRVSDKDPNTRYDRDEFMHLLKKGETDKGFLKDLLMGSFDVRYDFTQHYKDAAAQTAE
ncbi:hypothetical protein SLS53_000672 [Cytospora paraplurivora]|uniref:FAD-binding domain-containing protein n=1 Tax=Cytospora paraplurivora TaxID=2898453 RepID=A0AAN9UKB4_9PEZI